MGKKGKGVGSEVADNKQVLRACRSVGIRELAILGVGSFRVLLLFMLGRCCLWRRWGRGLMGLHFDLLDNLWCD